MSFPFHVILKTKLSFLIIFCLINVGCYTEFKIIYLRDNSDDDFFFCIYFLCYKLICKLKKSTVSVIVNIPKLTVYFKLEIESCHILLEK